MIYDNYQRNHVIFPGREEALEKFLKQGYKGMQHKWKNGFNSHSEDALTWSCFDVLRNFEFNKKISVLNKIFEDAYQDKEKLVIDASQYKNDQVEIYIGKKYTGASSKESTEVDASIELTDKLIFIEAKLYSTVSLASPEKPHDQIARKLRVGLDSPLEDTREFFFIFLDVAPVDKLNKRKCKEEAFAPSSGYHDKWKSTWIYKYYKHGRKSSLSPLKKVLEGIEYPPVETIADNMGWLTWSDLFKSVLQGAVAD